MLYGWGWNSDRQLGDPLTIQNALEPKLVPLPQQSGTIVALNGNSVLKMRWTVSNHKFFAQRTQQVVFSVLLSFKVMFSNNQKWRVMPKPIIFMILSMVDF